MKAVYYETYGSPADLRIQEVPLPAVAADHVLVRVQAGALNAWDWDLLTGTPRLFRFWGFFRPKYRIPGADVAGWVQAVGSAVTRFRVGDEVYGDLASCGWGAFAEFVSVPEHALCAKPRGVTFEAAAAVPQAACMALQGLEANGLLQGGESILLNGAGGGVGTFALQLARRAGAHVTAVDGLSKLARLTQLGADSVIDFATTDVTRGEQRFDLILDVVGKRSPLAWKRILKPNGRYVMVGGAVGRLFELLLWSLLLRLSGGPRLGILAAQPNYKLGEISQLLETGQMHTQVDSVFPLLEVQAAYRHYRRAEFFGKVVLRVGES